MLFLPFLPLTPITVPSGIKAWSHRLYQGKGCGCQPVGQRLGPWAPLRLPKDNSGCPGSHFIMPPSAWRDPEHTLLPAIPLHSRRSGFAHLLSFKLSCLKTSWKNINNQCLFPSFSRHTLAMYDVNVMGNQVRADRSRSSVYYLYYFSVDPKLFQNIKCVILCFF